jgi:hypothetical protein
MVFFFKAAPPLGAAAQQNLAVEAFYWEIKRTTAFEGQRNCCCNLLTQASCTDQNSAEFFTTFSAVEPDEETVPL